jgi:hypothetical protein
MPQHTVATTEPFLDLVGIPGLPTTLPLNTTISCDVTASGSGDDGEEISITQPTGTVTVVADTGQTGRFIDSSFSIDLNDGAGIASIETVGDYETIVWSVVEDGGGGGGGGGGTETANDPQRWRAVPFRYEETYNRDISDGNLDSPGGEGEQFFNWMFRSVHDTERIYGLHDCAVPWVSEDNGDTWKKLKSEFLYGRQAQSMLESPDDENILFVTMSDYNDTKDYGRKLKGIYKSENRGKSFTLLRRQKDIPTNDEIGKDRTNEDVLVYDPTLVDGERVYYWSTDGFGGNKVFYRSFGGDEWETVQSGFLTDLSYTAPDGRTLNYVWMYQTAVHPTNHKVFLATSAGLFVSENAHTAPAGEVTFTPVGNNLPHWITSIVFDPNDSSGNTVYCCSVAPEWNGFGDGKVYKSTDGGVNWSGHISRELLGLESDDITFSPYNIFISPVDSDTAWVVSGPTTTGTFRTYFFDDFSSPDFINILATDREIKNEDEDANQGWHVSLTGTRTQIVPYPDITRKNEAIIMSMGVIVKTTDGKQCFYNQDWFKGENWSSMAFDPEDDTKIYVASEDTAISEAVCDTESGDILWYVGRGFENVFTGWFTTKNIFIDGEKLYTSRGYAAGKRKLCRLSNRSDPDSKFEIPPSGVDIANLHPDNIERVENFENSEENKFVPHNFDIVVKHPVTGRLASGDNISTDASGEEFIAIPSLRQDGISDGDAISAEILGMSVDSTSENVYLWAVNGTEDNNRNLLLRGLWDGTENITWEAIEKGLDPQTTDPDWPRDEYRFLEATTAHAVHPTNPNIIWIRVVPRGSNSRFDGHLYRYDHSQPSGSRWTELSYPKQSAEEYSSGGIISGIQDDNGQNYINPEMQFNAIGDVVYDPNGGSLYPNGILYTTPYYASGHIIYRSFDLGDTWEHMDYDLPCTSTTKIALNPITGELLRGGCDGQYVHPPPIGYIRRSDWRSIWSRSFELLPEPQYP